MHSKNIPETWFKGQDCKVISTFPHYLQHLCSERSRQNKDRFLLDIPVFLQTNRNNFNAELQNNLNPYLQNYSNTKSQYNLNTELQNNSKTSQVQVNPQIDTTIQNKYMKSRMPDLLERTPPQSKTLRCTDVAFPWALWVRSAKFKQPDQFPPGSTGSLCINSYLGSRSSVPRMATKFEFLPVPSQLDKTGK